MGRKSLLTSTEKRKAAVKKKAAPAKSVKASETKKMSIKGTAKALQKAVSTKKAAATSRAAAKANPAVEQQKKPVAAKVKAAAKAKVKAAAKAAAKPKIEVKAPDETKAKKVTAPKKPKVKIKDLLLKKFDVGLSKQPVVGRHEAGKAPAKLPEAPPFVTGYDEKETKRIRALLFKGFDSQGARNVEKPKERVAPKKAAKPRAKAKGKSRGAAAAKKPKVKLKDLLLKRFDVGLAKQSVTGQPHEPRAALRLPEAPPFVTGYDEKETKRIRALLFKSFVERELPVRALKEAAPDKAATRPSSAPEALPEYTPAASTVSEKGKPTDWMMMGCLWGLGILLIILVAASFSNRAKFYLEDADGVVQVWRGRFAPLGKEWLLSLDGIKKTSLPAQDVYSKEEIYPILFGYLQDEADAALNNSRGPDLGEMKGYLRQAAAYAPNAEARRKVELHLKNTDFMVLFHKADMALTGGTLADLEAARSYLDKADSYASRDYQRELVRSTRRAVDKEIAALKVR